MASQHEFARLGQSFRARQLCTVKLTRHFFPQFRHYGLSALVRRFAIPDNQRHRALDDVQALRAVLQQITALFPEAIQAGWVNSC
ncbi:MAG: exonuclease domain-containing protein [Thiolinea sp.]